MRAILVMLAVFACVVAGNTGASAHSLSHERGARWRGSSVTVAHRQQAPAFAVGLGYGLAHMMASADRNRYADQSWPNGDTMGRPEVLDAPGFARPVGKVIVGRIIVTQVARVGVGITSVVHALSAPCREAAREGGPCGCHTAEILLHTSEHVYHGINVWLANGWLAFRHVAAAPGTAAVWVNRHVAPVVAVDYQGGTVTVADYYGTHTAQMAGLIFVDPSSR